MGVGGGGVTWGLRPSGVSYPGGVTLQFATSGAATMLSREANGLSLSFTDSFFHSSTGRYGSARVKDTATPANYYNSHPQGLLTYSGPSLKLTLGPTGTLRYNAHNLVLRSEAIGVSGSGWSVSGLFVTDAQPDPHGGNTAQLLVKNTATGQHRVARPAVGQFTGAPMYGKIRIKYAGHRYVDLELPQGGVDRTKIDVLNGQYVSGTLVPVITALGDGWYEYSLAGIKGGGSSTIYIELMGSGDTDGTETQPGDGVSGVYVWRAQVGFTPSDGTYLKTTDSAAYELPYEWDVNGNLLGIRKEAQVTNLCLWSDDLTNAAWTKTNCSAAKTATGPGGVANGASTLTATAANATCLQAITSASAERITFCWIKRRTGTGTIEMTQDNGSTWAAVPVTGEWAQVAIPAATSANPTVGIRVVTSGDAIDVALFNHHVAGAVSSPIHTAGSTVTRAADVFGPPLAAFPWNGGLGAYEVDGVSETPTNNGTILTLAPRAGQTHISTVKWVPSP